MAHDGTGSRSKGVRSRGAGGGRGERALFCRRHALGGGRRGQPVWQRGLLVGKHALLVGKHALLFGKRGLPARKRVLLLRQRALPGRKRALLVGKRGPPDGKHGLPAGQRGGLYRRGAAASAMNWDEGTWDSGSWDSAPLPYFSVSTKPKHHTTMKKDHYYPDRSGDQIKWLNNFADRLPDHATALGLTAAVVTAAVTDARYAAFIIGEYLADVDEFSKAARDSADEALTTPGTAAVWAPRLAKKTVRLVAILPTGDVRAAGSGTAALCARGRRRQAGRRT